MANGLQELLQVCSNKNALILNCPRACSRIDSGSYNQALYQGYQGARRMRQVQGSELELVASAGVLAKDEKTVIFRLGRS
jgi:hypothetical protein